MLSEALPGTSVTPLTHILPAHRGNPSWKTTLTASTCPFGTPTRHDSPDATGALVGTNTTFGSVQGHHSGTTSAASYATGTEGHFLKLRKEYTKDWSYAQTGRDRMAAPAAVIQRNTDARDVETLHMELRDALTASKIRVQTPLQAEAWEAALITFQLTARYPTLVNSIVHGFDVGIPRITHTFSPPNRLNDELSLNAFTDVMNNERRLGRWLGPYPRLVINSVIGHFRTSPVSIIPKPGKPGKFRLVQNFSHPHKPIYNATISANISFIN